MCVHVCVNACMCVCVYECVYVSVFVSVNCVYVCVCLCLCVSEEGRDRLDGLETEVFFFSFFLGGGVLVCVTLFELVSDKQGKLLGQRIQLSLTPGLLTMALLSPVNRLLCICFG